MRSVACPRLIREKADEADWIWLTKEIRFGASSSQDDQPSAGFEELAMPLFDPLYNFATMRLGLLPTAIPLALTEKLVRLQGR
jgi:hypothetical protein